MSESRRRQRAVIDYAIVSEDTDADGLHAVRTSLRMGPQHAAEFLARNAGATVDVVDVGAGEAVPVGASWLQMQLKELEEVLATERQAGESARKALKFVTNQLNTERAGFKAATAKLRDELAAYKTATPSPPPPERPREIPLYVEAWRRGACVVCKLPRGIPQLYCCSRCSRNLQGDNVTRDRIIKACDAAVTRERYVKLPPSWMDELMYWSPAREQMNDEYLRRWATMVGVDFDARIASVSYTQPEPPEPEPEDPTAARFAGLDLEEEKKP